MRDFRTLTVWQRAHALVLKLYKVAATFPPEELYGLASQVRRAGASVPTNIAEGCGTDGGLEFARFLQMAMRSACEVDYQLLLSRDLGFINPDEHLVLERELAEVKRILNVLIRKVRQDARQRAGWKRYPGGQKPTAKS
jgi:four helix bundle protein